MYVVIPLYVCQLIAINLKHSPQAPINNVFLGDWTPRTTEIKQTNIPAYNQEIQ